jgi:hypothetical protein
MRYETVIREGLLFGVSGHATRFLLHNLIERLHLLREKRRINPFGGSLRGGSLYTRCYDRVLL